MCTTIGGHPGENMLLCCVVVLASMEKRVQWMHVAEPAADQAGQLGVWDKPHVSISRKGDSARGEAWEIRML